MPPRKKISSSSSYSPSTQQTSSNEYSNNVNTKMSKLALKSSSWETVSNKEEFNDLQKPKTYQIANMRMHVHPLKTTKIAGLTYNPKSKRNVANFPSMSENPKKRFKELAINKSMMNVTQRMSSTRLKTHKYMNIDDIFMNADTLQVALPENEEEFIKYAKSLDSTLKIFKIDDSKMMSMFFPYSTKNEYKTNPLPFDVANIHHLKLIGYIINKYMYLSCSKNPELHAFLLYIYLNQRSLFGHLQINQYWRGDDPFFRKPVGVYAF